MLLAQAVRVLILTTLGFVVAFAVTPFWLRFLKNYGIGRSIRTGKEAPIYNKFHEKKGGTPNGGGIIIWSTVLGLAAIFGIFGYYFDGIWNYLNFINRA